MKTFNRLTRIASLIAGLAALALTGCGSDSSHEEHAHESEVHAAHEDEHSNNEEHADEGSHGHDHGGQSVAGGSYVEGEGVQLGEAAASRIGLQTDVVTQRKLTIEFQADARVYETAHAHAPESGKKSHHDSHAAAILDAHMAEYLTPGQPVTIEGPEDGSTVGRLQRLDTESARAIGQVEAIVDVPDPEHRHDFGTFITVTFSGGEREVLSVPASAVLDAARGTFVYVKNGERFLRTPVTTGVSGSGLTEIISGVEAGDEVVSGGVVDLWLVELRFTRAGGHAH